MKISKNSITAAARQAPPKLHLVTVQSRLAQKISASGINTSALNGNSLTASGAPTVTAWTAAQPSKENTATTGEVTGSGKTGAISLSLKKGGVYSFSSAYSYAYSGKAPSVYMTVADSSGKVVATGKSGSLTWTASSDGDYVITLGVTPAKGGDANFSTYKIDAVQNLSKIPTSSGDKNIDSVLAGSNYWWHDAGSVATASTTAVTDKIKQLNGASSKIYYGFLAGDESYLSTKDSSGFAVMDSDQQGAVKTAFDYLSSLINVEFVHDETQANIEFGTNDQTSSSGYANYPLGNGANPSVLLLDNSNNTGNSGSNLGTKGGYGWETLIHEIGHAMGLKHPGSYDAGGGKPTGPFLSSALDNRAMSIMSYNNPLASQVLSVSGTSSIASYSYSYSLSASNPYTYQTYDVAALQYLYGANKTTVGSDLTLTDSYNSFQTIWAPQSGGVKLDASGTTRANLFDLRSGGYSSVSMRLTDADKISEIASQFSALNFSSGNASAAASAVYTSLKASKNSSKVSLNTTLYNGKNNLSLSYGSTFSEVTGGKSTDKFYASTANVTIDGGAGTDSVYLQGTAKDWVVDANKTKATSKSGVVITLKNIEAISFYKVTEKLIHS